MKKHSVVDLFAGAGGLSLGFEQSGHFEIKAAFESNIAMQKTYCINHPHTEVLGDVCAADYHDLIQKYGEIDVVIGGPPCQGFSNANRQKNHAISKNNMLIKQYIRAVAELQPKAFIMENVGMLHSEVHRFFLDKSDQNIVEKYGIPVKETKLILLDRDYAFSGAVDIIRSTTEIKKYLWPADHYFGLNIVLKAAKNPRKMKETLERHKRSLLKIASAHTGEDSKDYVHLKAKQAFTALMDYFDGKIEASKLYPSIAPAIMIQRMLSTACEFDEHGIVVDQYLEENGVTAIIRSYAVYDYLKALLGSEENGYVINSKVLCAADYGAPQRRMRFVVMGIKKEISAKSALPKSKFDEDEYRTVRDAIGDIEEIEPVVNVADDTGFKLRPKDLDGLGASLRDSETLYNHIVTKTRVTAMERFKVLKQGQNFHALIDSLKTNTYTDASRTQNTIYLRLNYDEPCGTVVNVRKSMWIHPTLDRAVSVREAARLQTFPDSFIFCGTKDQQYQQVGNAVPPIIAKAIADKLAALMHGSGAIDSRNAHLNEQTALVFTT